MENKKYKIIYRNKELEIEQLPNGKFKKPSISQFTKQGLGSVHLDDCRIPTSEKVVQNFNDFTEIHGGQYASGKKITTISQKEVNSRFPANLLVSDDVLNDGKISKFQKMKKGSIRQKQPNNVYKLGFTQKEINDGQYAPDCYGDSGSYSRYFSLDNWWEERVKNLPEEVRKVFPFLLCPKASKLEKNKGLKDSPEISGRPSGVAFNEISGIHYEKTKGNFHPTTKPVKLMSWLITLGSRENDIILDPFAGSCTTGVACKILNRKFIGIEMNKEYLDIGMARIKGCNNE